MPDLPVLYSFRRCPYAIRARMAIACAGVAVELREVVLRDKPAAMLDASPKGTVPVLVLPDGAVIDESLEVMNWALDQADPANWRSTVVEGSTGSWIAANDGPFKKALDRYKYADRHPEHPPEYYRAQGEVHLARLEAVLGSHGWLHGASPGLVDVALFPFVRQFAMVDFSWFETSAYGAVRRWLTVLLEDPLFLAVMEKYPRWKPMDSPLLFRPQVDFLGPGATG